MCASAIEEGLWQAMEQAAGLSLFREKAVPMSGGCINRCFRVAGRDGTGYFLKLNRNAPEGMFAAEAAGLRALAATQTVRVPAVVAHGVEEGTQFLLLEALRLGGAPRGCGAELGRQLAALHRHEGPDFGFDYDNFIGRLPQRNLPWLVDWMTFFREHRLLPQFRWAEERGLRIGGQAGLLERLGDFFEGHSPPPSLLHGDLWGGNIDADENGYPVLFDPACYFGDREADLAMTELFGGPGRAFYEAYREAYPLDPGYERRRNLYNLYHILNHYNHFGGGYGAQAVSMVEALVAWR